MDVFAFRKELISEYERFSRSFTSIRAADIRQVVDEAYDSGRFWPAPLIQLNPNFVPGGSIEEFVANGTLDAECAEIFRIKNPTDPLGQPLVLHKHQAEAIAIARRGESYVLTTGTGSGKSLSYFIPIVNDVLRRKKSGDPGKGICAIVVYPMNALCNSQCEELEKFLKCGYGEGNEPVTFARYTGQETNEEREHIAKNPPDILLTNFVMLELIMTRFMETDKAVRQHADGLRFLVLDELHTYRGRQGADVALLIRRVRERFNEHLLCIGTSATMASEGPAKERNAVVADIASKLFGVVVNSDNIITETLEPVTNDDTPSDLSSLRHAIEAGVPASPTYDELSRHPVAAWVERKLGLEERDGKLVRIARPRTSIEASKLLAEDSGLKEQDCRKYLVEFLLAAYQSQNDSGRNFFAFRLHQFISGAWNAYATLEAPGDRFITLEGQQFTPGDRNRLLFNLSFCRQCGQEYFPVWATMEASLPTAFSPRELSERSNEEEEVLYGYLMPDSEGVFDSAALERHYPEDWLEFHDAVPRLKSNYRRYRPVSVCVDTLGKIADSGLPAWFIPGSFRFCLNSDCDAYYGGSVRSELSKLSGLSSEGRSSATTMLALSSLRHLIGTSLEANTKKLLAFTDNRQDASLQAGHFNDFIQTLLLRGALLAAMQKDGHLADDVLTQRVLEHLHLDPTDYAANPETKGIRAQTTLKTLRDVLGYRLYFDLQRGWRINNPNLDQLGLLDIRYRDLETCCEDEEEWRRGHPLLGAIGPQRRSEIVHKILDQMRKALCIKTIYLDPDFQEQTRNRSFNELKEPWGLSEDERLSSCAFMVPRPSSRARQQDYLLSYMSHRSAFGQWLKSQAAWGQDNPHYPVKFDEDVYNRVIDDILRVLTIYGYVESTELDGSRIGYRIDSSVLEWHLSADTGETSNPFFHALYKNIARLLEGDDCFLHQLEAREHTAQVDAEIRKERETRFRKGLTGERIVEGKVESAGLPILFCSPTMELGVDISALNAVYMRNVPPAPANYAQRSGRAGRSGQPALVITYCAAKSPHDQYFFSDPTRMVSGVVNPPTIDLANEDLIRSHLHSVWLAETGVELGTSVCDVLNREQPAELPLHEHLAEPIGSARALSRAQRRAQRILAMLDAGAAPWSTETWLGSAMKSAVRRFDRAFRRWRSLYHATVSQLESANDILNSAAATEQDRREAKMRYDEAYTQQNLLLDNKPTINSDFSTYRYLAAEGFLPGYNFPRLPLMAFIPGRHQNVVRDSFLSRPRFLGLSEFGPQSIIYHEGSTYRVRRIILTVRDEASAIPSAKLPVQAARICSACGYGHFGEQKDSARCANCDALLTGGRSVSNLYRIEQVATRRTMRITSDEEERQRQGYEMITTLRFAAENGKPCFEGVELKEQGEQLLKLKYGPAATIWRINLGWRRRDQKSIYGFSVDANTGEWTKDPQAPTDAEDDGVQDGKTIERITPFVEDTRNVLVVQPQADLPTAAIISLQYALKRGIEQEFQLEEDELAAEPLPDQNNRAAILFYEAAEGGAGVLTRLTNDPDALARVARQALHICHFTSKSGAYTDSSDLEDQDSDCEAGCYRCLLSYYNQPDHANIDRRDEDMINLLCRLTRGEHETSASVSEAADSFDELMNASTSSLEQAWLNYLKTNGYHLPDRAQPYLEKFSTRPDFAYADQQTLIYIDGPHHGGKHQTTQHLEEPSVGEAGQQYYTSRDAEITQRLEDAGFTVVRFPANQALWSRIANEYAWVFGPGKCEK